MWFLLFDLKHSQALHMSQWWNIINNEMYSRSFWIVYKSSFGNSHKFYKFFLLWWFIFVLSDFLTTIFTLNFNLCMAIAVSHILIICLIIFLLWHQLPIGVCDVFYIRNEIKYFISLLFFMSVMQLIIALLETRDNLFGWQVSSIMARFGVSL